MFTLYNPTSDSDVINVFVYLSKPNDFVLKAAKLVFPKLITRASHIVWWLYHYTEHGM